MVLSRLSILLKHITNKRYMENAVTMVASTETLSDKFWKPLNTLSKSIGLGAVTNPPPKDVK